MTLMHLRLPTFLFLSLAAHAGLLGWHYQDAASVRLDIGGQAQALNVTVTPPSRPPGSSPTQAAAETASLETAEFKPASPAPAPRPVSRKPDNKASNIASLEQSAVDPHPVRTSRQAPVHTTLPIQPSRPQTSAENTSQRISAALQNQLASRFEYPWLARKRGWQGQVMLSLQVHDNGNLSNWQIATTSGYPVLDRSALKAAREIHYLPEADRLLQNQGLQLLIPVQYQLLDS